MITNNRSDSFSKLDNAASINLTVSDKSIDSKNDRDDTLYDAHDVLVSDEEHNIEKDQPADLDSAAQNIRKALTCMPVEASRVGEDSSDTSGDCSSSDEDEADG